MFETQTHIELKCDEPSCDISYKWVDEEVGKGAPIPDPAYRFLILALPFNNKEGAGKWCFCSHFCLLKFLKALPTARSPREQLEEVNRKAAEIAEEEKRIEEVERMANEGGAG